MSQFSLDTFPLLYLKINGFSSRIAETEFGPIHYLEKKARNPRGTLVFLHGIGSCGFHFSRILVPLSREGYTILAPDMPGHGLSPDFEGRLTRDTLYETFAAWANQAAPEKFHLVGNSMGGGLGLLYGLRCPERIDRMVMASPAGGFSSEEEWIHFREIIMLKSKEKVRDFMNRVFHRNPLYLPLLYRTVYQAFNRKNVRELVELSRFEDLDLGGEMLQDDWHKSFPPTLLIWGKSERLFSSQNLDWFKRILPPAVMIEEPQNIGHCPHFDNPRWFYERILQFIETPEPITQSSDDLETINATA